MSDVTDVDLMPPGHFTADDVHAHLLRHDAACTLVSKLYEQLARAYR